MKIKIYYDPQENESVGSAIIDAMNAEEKAPVEDASKEVIPAKEESKTKFAWGEEDRRKTRVEPKDDDEFDLGYEIEDGDKKIPAKAKLSEIRNAAKFLKENRETINAALGMKSELAKNPDLSKAFTSFWQNSFKDNKYNPEFVTKMTNYLEGKSEVVKDKIDESTDDIKEMETLLSELDDQSPQAKILRSNINGLKATRAQLKDALGTIQKLQEKTEGHDKFKTGFEETQKKQKEDADAQEATKLFNKEFGALTSKEGKSGYQFEDKDDSDEFESLVRDMVASQAAQGKINNDEEFTSSIREAAKLSFEKISRRNEKIVNGYLKKKGQLPPEKGKEKTNEKEIDPTDGKSIGQLVAEGMFPEG